MAGQTKGTFFLAATITILFSLIFIELWESYDRC